MRILTTAALCVAVLLSGSARAETPEEDRLINAVEVLEQLSDIPEGAIPPALLNSAYGVAVIPGVLKVSFILGVRRGKGVLVVRQSDGQWSLPSFVTITGGSFGWQAGAQSSDIILVFKNRRGVEGITSGKLTLGADAAVAAGPVGRYTSASTDAEFKSEVYSYSRSRGLFAGIALDGAALSIDNGANAAFYARPGISADEIFGAADITEAVPARRFVATLTSLTPETTLVPAPADTGSATRAEPAQEPEPAVRTYGIDEAADDGPPPAQSETREPMETASPESR